MTIKEPEEYSQEEYLPSKIAQIFQAKLTNSNAIKVQDRIKALQSDILENILNEDDNTSIVTKKILQELSKVQEKKETNFVENFEAYLGGYINYEDLSKDEVKILEKELKEYLNELSAIEKNLVHEIDTKDDIIESEVSWAKYNQLLLLRTIFSKK